MKLKLILLSLLFSIQGISQTNNNSNSFAITKSDLEIKTFEKDSTAHAYVIFELGNSYIDHNSFKLKTEIIRTIKILDRDGFNQANVEVLLHKTKNRKEKISNIQATTFNLVQNKIVKSNLVGSQIFNEKYNDKTTIVKFTLPQIKKGSIITYSYTIESPFIFNYKGWEFQGDIPKLHSEYRASIPGNYEYNLKLVGGKDLSKNESEIKKNCLTVGNGGSSNCFNSIYVMKDVPAFIEEDYMTSRNNYLARIDYELKIFKGFDGSVKNYTKSWKTADKELKTQQSIGKQLKKGSSVKEVLPSSILNTIDDLTKAKAIYKFVQENFNKNDELGIFKDVSLKKIIKNKSGSAAEINLLLFNLLKENNIEVNAVLISTRKNGLATRVYPVISDFNYIVTQATIDDETYLLDPTDSFLAFGQLPFKCLNQYGRLLDFENKSSWIPISPKKSTTEQYRVELNIEDEETLSGAIKSKKTGYYALAPKRHFNSNQEDYLNGLKEDYPNMEITDYNSDSENKNDNQFVESFNINLGIETIGDNIYLDPFLFKFLKENPFKLQERTYPIDFGYKTAYSYSFKLNLNDKFEVKELPVSKTIKLPNNKGILIFNTKKSKDSITLYFKFNLGEEIYTSDYYSYLKEFFTLILNTQNNSLIVLKKK